MRQGKTIMKALRYVQEKPRTSAEILSHLQAQFRVGAETIQSLRRKGLIKFDRQVRRWRLP